MKLHNFILFLFLMLLSSTQELIAKSITDTILTADRDKIILSYNIVQENNVYTIQFNGVLKKMSSDHKSRYKDLKKIAVLFFDQDGGYPEKVKISGMSRDAFMVPYNVKYEKSHDHYFMIEEEPRLEFISSDNSKIEIPIYLAYHSKRKFELFSKGEMTIHLSKKQNIKHIQSVQKSVVQTQTITSTEEIEADNTKDLIDICRQKINETNARIAETVSLPFSKEIDINIEQLKYDDSKPEINKVLHASINSVFDNYDAKLRELQENANKAQEAEQQKQEQQAAAIAKAEQARNDSIQAAQQRANEEEKSRNMWMIIGGVILAVLMFVGNQVWQGYRNARNQRKMADLQTSISNKAEAEARRMARRAENRVRSKGYSMQHKAQSTAKKAIENHVKTKSNNFSI